MVGNLLPDEGSEHAGVVGDVHDGRAHRLHQDVDRCGLVLVVHQLAALVGVPRHIGQAGAAARHPALDNRTAQRVDRVLVPQLFVGHLSLGRGTNLDASHRRPELVDTLLQALDLKLLVGLRVQFLRSSLEHLDTLFDRVRVPAVSHEDRLSLINLDTGERAQVGQSGVLQLHVQLGRDQRRPTERADVLEKALLQVAKARHLDGAYVEHAPVVVQDESREGLGDDVLGDDEQRLLLHHHRLQDRQQFGHGRQLVIHSQHVGVAKRRGLRLKVVGEQRRDVTRVELHALAELNRVDHLLVLFNDRRPIQANLEHRLRDDEPNLLRIGRHRGNLLVLLERRHRLRRLADLL
mmetsp:Transcript_33800/g.109221  ORF Transcript_33800/g.109221 Transcript_33800/m.109221 type:complete len:350 (+) Transcript_33800:604-1653(+)